MSKRQFRKTKQPRPSEAPRYPTLERFDLSRRGFLARLGAAVVGAGVGATLLSACGDGRTVGEEQPPPQGVPRMPDAKLDREPMMNDGGVAPMPDAQLDGIQIGGAAPAPDAGVDKADMIAAPGYAPVMDARVDDSDPDNP